MANQYTVADLASSMGQTGYEDHGLRVDPDDFDKVVAAWGRSGMMAEWSGGFLLRTTDDRYAYLRGGCDTTGWGCRSRAEIDYFDHKPTPVNIANLHSSWEDNPEGGGGWDIEPIDLNRWIRGEIDRY